MVAIIIRAGLMSELKVTLDQLHACAASGHSDTAEVLMFGQLDDWAMMEEPWSAELFRGVKGLLANDQFLALDSSWKLPKLIRQYWENLTLDQRLELGPVLLTVYDRFKNWMAAYVIAEILSEYYVDEAGFRWLDHLSKSARMPARALAA
jgi:hypothetical protein